MHESIVNHDVGWVAAGHDWLESLVAELIHGAKGTARTQQGGSKTRVESRRHWCFMGAASII